MECGKFPRSRRRAFFQHPASALHRGEGLIVDVEVGVQQAGPLIGDDRVVSEGARALPDPLDAGAERDP